MLEGELDGDARTSQMDRRGSRGGLGGGRDYMSFAADNDGHKQRPRVPTNAIAE